MCVYLRPEFQISSIILTDFRQGRAVILPKNKANAKRSP